MRRLILSNFIPLVISLPSIIIGAIAMFSNKVPIIIWGQNIGCLLILGSISSVLISRKSKIKKRNSTSISILLMLTLLMLTFFDFGLQGVHRWVSIGPVKFYATSIAIPIVFIELWNVLQTKNWWISVVITIVISILLTLQPDASQLTAFIIPMIILIWSKTNNKFFRYSILGLLSILAINSWIFLDGLPPVSYVEEIVSLVANMGIIWLVLGIISLVILPLPFILFPSKNSKLLSICIGIYFIIILISTIFGNFPVPLMGYGVSPIIGYFISITWLVKSKINSKSSFNT